MKKLTLLLILAILNTMALMAQNVNIPDANFKAYLVGNSAINTNGDTEIQTSEAAAFTGGIDCSEKSISDLTGIEAFTNLDSLACHWNQISSLDVSQNTALRYLGAGIQPSLTSLNIGSNTTLEIIWLEATGISSLDVSLLTELKVLSIAQTPISQIDLSQNTKLEYFRCFNFPNAAVVYPYAPIPSLDLSQNTALKILLCGDNQITNLDLSQNTALENLQCHNNELTNLDLSQNVELEALRCNGNSLGSLDLSQNVELEELRCDGNSLSSLDLSQNDSLKHLWCNNNQLTSLDVSQNDSLKTFHCNDNQLTKLNVANGQNGNLISFKGNNNPNLSCIQVDENFTPPNYNSNDGTGWLKDSMAVYDNTGAVSITQSADTLLVTAGFASYQWINCSDSTEISGATSASFTPSASGVYAVVVSNGTCSKTSDCSDFILSNVIETGDFKGLSVYPNPTSKVVNIKLENQDLVQIRLTDIVGRTVKTFDASLRTLDISDVSASVYFLELSTSKERVTVKLFVE